MPVKDFFDVFLLFRGRHVSVPIPLGTLSHLSKPISLSLRYHPSAILHISEQKSVVIKGKFDWRGLSLWNSL